MRGCNIYPVLFREHKCNECPANKGCKNQEEERYEWVRCDGCGFSVELKSAYVKNQTVVCPLCKERVME